MEEEILKQLAELQGEIEALNGTLDDAIQAKCQALGFKTEEELVEFNKFCQEQNRQIMAEVKSRSDFDKMLGDINIDL